MSLCEVFLRGARKLPHSPHPTFHNCSLVYIFCKNVWHLWQARITNVSAENELNHLLTMFTQKFYEDIKDFQFHFARGIVYGEESGKSS